MDYRKQLEKWARRRDRFKSLVAQGWTCRKIAEAEGLSVQRVHKIVNGKVKAKKKDDSSR